MKQSAAAILVSAWSAILLAGCAEQVHELRLDARAGIIPVAKKFDITSALLITPESAAYLPPRKPDDIYGPGAGLSFVIPLGKAMKQASIETFRQMFRDMAVIEKLGDGEDFDIVVEPTITSFHYRFPLIAPFTGRSVARLGIELKIHRRGREIWAKAFETPDIEGPVYGASIGRSNSGSSLETAASESLAEALRLGAAAMMKDAELKRVLAKAGTGPRAVASRERETSRPAPAASIGPPARFSTQPVDVKFAKRPERPDDVAVIIGNANYQKQGKDIPDVVPAYADADSFKRYAMRTLGVREGNIIDLRDATSAQFVRVFGSREDHRGQLFDWVRPGRSRVTVYYAGHGAPAGADGSAYLIPADADAARIRLNGYPLATLYENLGQLPAESVTVVLEACFSGASQGGSVLRKASPVYLKPKVTRVPPKVTVIAAGAGDQIASWEEDDSHGLFTKYFLKAMSGEADRAPYGNGDGEVGGKELEAYLKDTMTYYARRYYGRDQVAQIVHGKGG